MPAVSSGPQATVTWPELMAATSLAADTGMALPLETGLATSLVAVELGRRLDLDESGLQRVFHLALLQHIGCTAATTTVAEVVGDELLMREHATLLDFSDQREMFRFMLAHVARANPVSARPVALARAMVGGGRITSTVHDVCEAGQMLAERSGYAREHLVDLLRVYEHWDGSGFPDGLSGEEIPLPVHVVQAATLAVNAERLMGARRGAGPAAAPLGQGPLPDRVRRPARRCGACAGSSPRGRVVVGRRDGGRAHPLEHHPVPRRSTAPWRRSVSWPTSSRRTTAGTRSASPSSPPLPRGATASVRRTPGCCCGRATSTTSAGSRCRPASGPATVR